jgi:hypothetical protein
MIHQFIFAGPKPGLTAEAFQSYWVNFHAVDYASKIPQIMQYLIATRTEVGIPNAVPFFEGVAEIWLKNEEEQLASLMTPEFLNGARQDEPRWAAFWRTFVHDGDPTILKDSDLSSEQGPITKVYVLLKRKPESSLDDFQKRLLDDHAKFVLTLPSLKKYEIAMARPSSYGFGEPRFDAIEVWSITGAPQFKAQELVEISKSWATLADPRYLFTFTGQEHWIISNKSEDSRLLSAGRSK